jgi:mRNA interferase RelE/StbE
VAWQIKFEKIAAKQMMKLDKSVSKKIIDYLRNKVSILPDPKTLGSALIGDKSGLWRYRIENHRVICQIKQKEIVITVLQVGHRKYVYRK